MLRPCPRDRPGLPAAALLVALTTAACSASGTPAAPSQQAGFRYTCCSAEDVDPVRHPGDTISLHWSAEGTPEATSVAATVSAELSGPYPTVQALKAGYDTRSSAPVHVTGPAVHVPADAAQPPVTSVTVPAGAAAGWYGVTFTADTGTGTVSGSTIVQVAAPG